MREQFRRVGKVRMSRLGVVLSLLAASLLIAVGEAPSVSAAQPTQTYNVSPSAQTYTVPTGVSRVRVTVKSNASTGRSSVLGPSTGGAGVSIVAELAVTAGETFRIYFDGSDSEPCQFGPDNGISATRGYAVSFQKLGDANRFTNALIAGAGGTPGCASNTQIGGSGGNAGVPTGSAGAVSGSSGGNGGASIVGGGGGATTSGGAGGTGGTCNGSAGLAPNASVLSGVVAGGSTLTGCGVLGGRGGWGYSGGGGGAAGNGSDQASGGGGGSSYVAPTWTFVSAAANSASATSAAFVTVQDVTPAVSSDADLSNLALSSGSLSPAFASGTTTYTASVANSVSSVTVTPTVSDAGASVTVESVAVTSGQPSGAISLSTGSNTISVVVTAADTTTTKTYTIIITRGSAADPVDQTPPTWLQAYSRLTAESACKVGWRPSYAEWPNAGRGGWTCERRVYWNAQTNGWVEAPGFSA